MRFQQPRRRGVTVFECAVAYPLAFLLLLALVIGGMGVFRYQETASLAREGARWASVHGTDYAKDSSVPAATAADVYNQVIVPKAVGLDTSRLSYSVTWDASNSPYHVKVVNGDLVAVTNTVTVQVTYQWIPEALLGGITLSSTSVMPISY